MKQSNQINNTDILRPEITSPNESDSEIDVDHDKRSKPSPKIESEQPFQGLSRVGQGENLNKSTLRKNESKLKDKADDNSREKAPSGEDSVKVNSTNEPSNFANETTNDAPNDKVNGSNEPINFLPLVNINTPVDDVEKDTSSNESSGFGKVGSLDTPVDDNDIPRIDHFNISDEPRYFDQQGNAETPDYKLDKVIPGISFGSDEASQGGFSQKEAVGTPVDNLKQVNSSNEPSVLDQELMVETPEDDKREVAETEKKPDSFSKACPEASNLDGWDFSNDFGFLERPFLDDPNPEVKEETVALEDLDDQFPEEVRFLRELNQRLDDLDQMFKTLKEQVDDNTKKISVLEGRNFNKGSNS